jgi:hypothetical protein
VLNAPKGSPLRDDRRTGQHNVLDLDRLLHEVRFGDQKAHAPSRQAEGLGEAAQCDHLRSSFADRRRAEVSSVIED